MPGVQRPLRIAQVAPLYESVPPQLYGGTERVVAYLTDELVAAGHEVTLFASGDSRSQARVIAPCARALRLAGCADPIPHHLVMLEDVYRRAREFDIVHFHCDYLHYAATRRAGLTHVTTLHGRLDLPDLSPLYAEFSELPFVSISYAQREPLPATRWIGNIYHGLPRDLHALGRPAAPTSRSSAGSRRRSVSIARSRSPSAAGRRLRVAAKLDDADRDYYADVIEPIVPHAPVDLLGELGELDKGRLLRRSLALVFPIDWPEPFGLAMIEAMALRGTPVIAFPGGSVREVIDEGVTGFVVETVDEAARAVERARKLSRAAVRARFEERFTSARMARDYVDLYAQLIHTEADAIDRSGEPGLLHPGDQLAHG